MLGPSEQKVRDREQQDALGEQLHLVSRLKHYLDSIRHVILWLLGSVRESLSAVTTCQKAGMTLLRSMQPVMPFSTICECVAGEPWWPSEARCTSQLRMEP